MKRRDDTINDVEHLAKGILDIGYAPILQLINFLNLFIDYLHESDVARLTQQLLDPVTAGGQILIILTIPVCILLTEIDLPQRDL